MKQGFSLLELSIVLVIIGLITGGIMAGRSMVRAAELRSVMSDIQKYQSAVNTFREKYQAIPGDMKNAVKYWGAQAGGTADGTDSTCTALTTPATGTATCNGNGDAIINGGTPEMWRFWQHLANAGLIEGQYSGISNSTTYAYAVLPGTNTPTLKIAGLGVGVRYVGLMSGNANWFDGFYPNQFEIGSTTSGTNWPANGAQTGFYASEVYLLDTKYDDGLPATGNITGMNSTYWTTNCVTTDVPSTATWAVSATTKACGMMVKGGF